MPFPALKVVPDGRDPSGHGEYAPKEAAGHLGSHGKGDLEDRERYAHGFSHHRPRLLHASTLGYGIPLRRRVSAPTCCWSDCFGHGDMLSVSTRSLGE